MPVLRLPRKTDHWIAAKAPNLYTLLWFWGMVRNEPPEGGVVSKNLEQRVEDVLSIAREDRFEAAHWERRMKAACAQVFFLGMSVGWDKCAAVTEPEKE